MTEVLSDGRLRNISILDFPAFGSKMDHIEKDHQKSPTWPTEVNFALHNSLNGNLSQVFFQHKNLLEDWKHHMESLYDADSAGTFTYRMQNNEILNFTKYIKEDMKTFLLSLAGNKSPLFYLIFH